MPDTLISVIDLAAQHGLLKQTIFKVLNRLSIEPTKRLGSISDATGAGSVIGLGIMRIALRAGSYKDQCLQLCRRRMTP